MHIDLVKFMHIDLIKSMHIDLVKSMHVCMNPHRPVQIVQKQWLRRQQHSSMRALWLVYAQPPALAPNLRQCGAA